MKVILIGIVILISFSCCATKKEMGDIEIVQLESTYPIILRGDTIKNRIFRMHYPLVYRIKKNSSQKMEISDPTYLCNGGYIKEKYNRNWSVSLSTNIVDNNNNSKIEGLKSNDKRRFLNESKTEEYIFNTNHLPDSTQQVQNLLRPYLEKMKEVGKDTLHIGSIQQLKKSNPDLVNGFLKGDSICITYLKENKFFHIFLPVEIK